MSSTTGAAPPNTKPVSNRTHLFAGCPHRLYYLALAAEGLPGVGKTTLAVALAHHPRILTHFRDGILWAGLGPTPDVMSLLGNWAQELDRDGKPPLPCMKRI